MNWLVTVAHQPVAGLPSTKDYAFRDEGQARMFLRSCRSDGQPASLRALGEGEKS